MRQKLLHQFNSDAAGGHHGPSTNENRRYRSCLKPAPQCPYQARAKNCTISPIPLAEIRVQNGAFWMLWVFTTSPSMTDYFRRSDALLAFDMDIGHLLLLRQIRTWKRPRLYYISFCFNIL
ncbi:hypothetical protein CEXT_659021 [Caerostris extrusa]|uniref:Uncharacterized protein n=1 Tax=Caerostris extrusa TaxID=172846 RepID=A0AAV4P3Q7_CAEEX|nr:hypothetical protein CEXT_659021 [Caerostris extrusa]